jgi:hypothetical protein
MNCFFETVASMWIMTLRTVKGRPPTDLDDDTIQESLEGCRMSLEVREKELVEACKRLGHEAVRRKAQADLPGAKAKLMERRRAVKRLEKLRNSLSLVDTQLDALRNTELDKELMHTLMASSAALKKAGVGTGVREAEAVMSELDEQMREASELNSVLSSQALEVDLEFDLEEELNTFMQEEKEAEDHPVVAVLDKQLPPVPRHTMLAVEEEERPVKIQEQEALLPAKPVKSKSGHQRQLSRMMM